MPPPLSGYRVIELAGIGPGPYAGQLLADMGADVINVERPLPQAALGMRMKTIDMRGKKSIIVDLRKPGGAEIVLELVKTADVLIEGNRPGVAERMGVGPEDCHKLNPKLIYGRMTGWGQDGPWANMAGHDINYLALTGALHAMGEKGRPPTPPLNLVGDYGGGSLFLALGVVAALLRAQTTGKGEIVDAAIIDGTASMMGIVHSLASMGIWQPKRQSNILDGAAPYYRCYAAQDGKFVAVGCIEPQFFAQMLKRLEIDPDSFGGQNDQSQWAGQIETLTEIFGSRTRDEWAEAFAGSDACVTPVLDYEEAKTHPHNTVRQSHQIIDERTHPHPVPRFAGCERNHDYTIADPGQHTRQVLESIGCSEAKIASLLKAGIIA